MTRQNRGIRTALVLVASFGAKDPALAGFAPIIEPSCASVFEALAESKAKFKEILGNPAIDSFEEVEGGVRFYSSENPDDEGIILSFEDAVNILEQFNDQILDLADEKFPGLSDAIKEAQEQYPDEWRGISRQVISCFVT